MFHCTLAESSKSKPIRGRFFPLADLRTGGYVSFRVSLPLFQPAEVAWSSRVQINRDETVISSDMYRAYKRCAIQTIAMFSVSPVGEISESEEEPARSNLRESERAR